MLTRKLLLYFYFMCFNVSANTDKTLYIYHDADYSLNQASAKAMQMGLLTALDEIDNKIQGFRFELIEKNHRGNNKRSLLTMKQFINDDNALFILGGHRSPPYVKNRTFINENKIPLLIPWAAAGPITRYPLENNSIFRLSIDDTKAGIRISEFALKNLSCKKPNLLLENTPWGKSNQITMSSYLEEKSPFGLTLFNWNIKENSARITLRNIISEGYDCLLLVAGVHESNLFVRSMAAMEKDKRIPIISHWGVTGGDVDTIFTKKIKEAISFHFIQSCYSLSAPNQSIFQRSVISRAKTLFPEAFSSPEHVKASAGFIHAYDLTRIAIAALNQITLTNNIQHNRMLFKQSLESLQQPIQGLIKEYNKPFAKWSKLQEDAHEALRLKNFCMATFGQYNQINLTPD